MKKLLRKLLRLGQPRVSAEEAVAIARSFCEEKGWPFRHPIVTDKLGHWQIWTPGKIIPSPFIRISQKTGEILESGRGTR